MGRPKGRECSNELMDKLEVFYKDGHTVRDCVKEFNLPQSTIRTYLNDRQCLRNNHVSPKLENIFDTVIKPLFLAGKTIVDCSKETEIDQNTISRHLIRDGLFEGKRNFKEFYEQVLKPEFLSGIPVKTLVIKYHTSKPSVFSALAKDGLIIRQVPRKQKKEVYETIVKPLYLSGKTMVECSKESNLDTSFIQRLLKKDGILRDREERSKEIENTTLPLIINDYKADMSLPQICDKYNVSYKILRTLLIKHGVYKTPEEVTRWRKARCGERSHFFGRTPTANRFKKWQYDNEYFDSVFEMDFAKYLDENGIPWIRNGKRILLEDAQGKFSYVPDFIVDNEIVEIKGWFNPRAIRVMKAVLKAGIKVKFFDGIELKKLGIKVGGGVESKMALEVRTWYPYFGFDC